MFKSNTMLFNRKSSCCCCLVIIIVPCTKTCKIIFLPLLFEKDFCMKNIQKKIKLNEPFLRNDSLIITFIRPRLRYSQQKNNKTYQNENDSCFCRKSSVKILKFNNGTLGCLLIQTAHQ